MVKHQFVFIYLFVYISGMLNRWAVKKERLRTKKGLDKEVKSKWATKACVMLLLIEIKF